MRYSQPYFQTVEVLCSQTDPKQLNEKPGYIAPIYSKQESDSRSTDYLCQFFHHDSVVAYEHLVEIVEFVEKSPPYSRLLHTLAKVVRRYQDMRLGGDAIFVASTALKILEDAHLQSLRNDWYNPRSEEGDRSNTIKASSAVNLVHKMAAMISDKSKEIGDVSSYSVQTLVLHWLASRYLDRGACNRDCDTFFSVIDKVTTDRITDNATVCQCAYRRRERSIDNSFFCCKTLKSTPQYADDADNCFLLDATLATTTLADLLVLREIGYLYRSGVALHVVLCALSFAHETIELPFGPMRSLNLVYGLARRFLPRGQCETPNDIDVPQYLFLDQPLAEKSNRPTSLWWHTMNEQKQQHMTYEGPSRSLEDLALMCPQYARMRICVHWEKESKCMGTYNITHAWMDSHALLSLIEHSLSDCKKWNSGTTATDLRIIPHTKLLCGGPLEMSCGDILKCTDRPLTKSLQLKAPIGKLGRECDVLCMQQIVFLMKNEEGGSRRVNDPLLDYNDWVWVADACMMTYEVLTGRGPRGFGTFTTGQDGEIEQQEYIELKKMKFKPKRTVPFQERPLEIKEPLADPSSITYHLFRHDPRPIRPRTLHRCFPPIITSHELVERPNETLYLDSW